MKRFTIAATLLFVALALGGAEATQPDELTGVVKTQGVKALSPCVLNIDGSHSIGLRGEALDGIPDGAQVWVKGRLRTSLYDNRRDPRPAMNPRQWHIYMEVAEWKPIAAPFEKPKD